MNTSARDPNPSLCLLLAIGCGGTQEMMNQIWHWQIDSTVLAVIVFCYVRIAWQAGFLFCLSGGKPRKTQKWKNKNE